MLLHQAGSTQVTIAMTTARVSLPGFSQMNMAPTLHILAGPVTMHQQQH